MSPEYPKNTQRRLQILEQALAVVQAIAHHEKTMAATLLRSKSDLDGPMQSKQPDEMIKLEYRASLHQRLEEAYREKALQLQDIINAGENYGDMVIQGSVFSWEFKDPESSTKNEIVILTPSGGGEFDGFRLLSLAAPLTKNLIGKKAGDSFNFGDVTVIIKEII